MDLDDDMPIIVVEQPLDLINKIGITKYKDKAQPTLKIEKISEVPLRVHQLTFYIIIIPIIIIIINIYNIIETCQTRTLEQRRDPIRDIQF